MSPRPEVLALGCRDDDISMLSRAFERIEPDLRLMSGPRDLAVHVHRGRFPGEFGGWTARMNGGMVSHIRPIAV